MAFVLHKCMGRALYENGSKLLRLVGLGLAVPVRLPQKLKIRTLSSNASDVLLANNTVEHVATNTDRSDSSLDKLLLTVDKKTLDTEESIKFLHTLSDLTVSGLVQLSSYEDDPRFMKVCAHLGERTGRMHDSHLLKGLRSLLTMGLNPETKIVKIFENEVLWRIRKMNFKGLNICFRFHCHHKESELQMRVFTELVSAITSRWVEIADANDVINIMERASYFDEKFLTKVDERALSILEKMNIEELHNLTIALASCKRRPLPVLRSISHHTIRSSDRLKTQQVINMLHSLNVLNFTDEGILQKLSTDVLPEIQGMKGNAISSLLTSLGQLRWRNPALLDACCEWILTHLNICKPREIVSCILTLASLNYHPEEEEKLFAAIMPKLSQDQVLVDTLWLDVVVSLAILGRATSEHLSSVLEPDFYKPLCITGPSNFHDPSLMYKLKIMAINAVAKFEIPASNVSSDLGHILENLQIPQSKNMRESQELVLCSLSNFLPRGRYMATNVNTSLGILIDAEFIMDKNQKPLPIVDYGVKAGVDADLKPLPVGSNRVALLIWHFKDMTSSTCSLVGKNALAVRLLKKIGYKVVEIPYAEFEGFKTVVNQVQYLQKMINEKLKEPV